MQAFDWLKRMVRNWTVESNTPSIEWDKFRSTPGLVQALNAILKNQVFTISIRTVEDACPRGMPPVGAQPTDYAYLHGFSCGYMRAIDNLRMLGSEVEKEMPPPDFKTPSGEFQIPDELFT